MSPEDHGIPLLPIQPAIFTFEMDEAGLRLVREIIAYWQAHYGMSPAESVERLNERPGARDGEPAATIVEGEDAFWFNDSAEHIARQMIEGMYWVKRESGT